MLVNAIGKDWSHRCSRRIVLNSALNNTSFERERLNLVNVICAETGAKLLRFHQRRGTTDPSSHSALQKGSVSALKRLR